ncbi:MAG: MFS transporter, partial [Chloroflexota bacterium]|nr:MFS transporter [Chloroflexota bacterium]
MAKLNLKPSELAVGGHQIHYAWVIVAVAAVMRLFSSSFRSSSSILIPRLVDSFGWSYGAVGLGFAIQWIVSGLFGPPAGWLGDRYGVRWTMRLGALLFIVGMVLTGFMRELWQFYLFFGVILSAAMGIFQVPLTASVTLWFRKHLGTGMGLLQSSQGIGPLVAVPIMIAIIELFGGGLTGLRAAFWIPGIAGGAIILFLVKFFYNEPAQIGARPLGAPEDEPIQEVQTG